MPERKIDRVVDALMGAPRPLDDDQVAERTGIDRHYVNALCRRLAARGVVERFIGSEGKLVNQWRGGPGHSEEEPRRSRRHRATVAAGPDRQRVEALIDRFDVCIAEFDRVRAFTGPSLYFHERAIARRAIHDGAASLLADTRFLEYVYAVLPSWGMHRMGNQAAKVVDFEPMVEALRAQARPIQELWDLRITDLDDEMAEEVGARVWSVIEALVVSGSSARIVAGSKTLHHVLPNLVPPIDRQYTFQFFTGQKQVSDERGAFTAWFPLLGEIGRRRASSVNDVVERGGYMATGPAKVIDNAIVGFQQLGL